MKTQAEIQKAHDMLLGFLDHQGELEDEKSEFAIRSVADCLCWILEHEQNSRFIINLGLINAKMEELGFTFGKCRSHELPRRS